MLKRIPWWAWLVVVLLVVAGLAALLGLAPEAARKATGWLAAVLVAGGTGLGGWLVGRRTKPAPREVRTSEPREAIDRAAERAIADLEDSTRRVEDAAHGAVREHDAALLAAEGDELAELGAAALRGGDPPAGPWRPGADPG